MIRTEEIKKQYGDKQVLNGISTHIEQGEVLVIIGPLDQENRLSYVA